MVAESSCRMPCPLWPCDATEVCRETLEVLSKRWTAFALTFIVLPRDRPSTVDGAEAACVLRSFGTI
eukprot:scaffold146612_cov33-Tisochrysis_lutea.AAC.2